MSGVPGQADWEKTQAVLERMADLLRGYLEAGEAALVEIEIGDPDSADRHIEAALAGVAQLRALEMELATFWPADQTGRRGREGVPRNVLSLSDSVSALIERTAKLHQIQAEILGQRMAETSDALVRTRQSRRREARYRPKGDGSDPGLLDLHS